MVHGPKQPQTIRDCKLKRVHPRLPLRVHSTAPKGLAESGWGNPSRPDPTSRGAVRGSEWSVDCPRIWLQSELSSDAWRRLESAARRRGGSVEDFLLRALEEAS
jgi:hypothetical protein